MDASYKLAYEGTFPVNEVLPIQIMLPESNDYQILVTNLKIEEQEFTTSKDKKNEYILFVDEKTKTGLTAGVGFVKRLTIKCKDKDTSNTVQLYFSAG